MLRLTAVLLCVLFVLGVLSAQTGNGTITGVVTDPTGAVVANAAIEVKNTETGVVFRAVSTDTGNFTIPQLPIGSYELTTTVQGFKRYNRQNISLAAAQVLRLDVPLEIGASTEAVTVTAESTLLKTETGDLTHNITLQQLDNLPLLGVGNSNSGSSGLRNPFNVAQTIPGVSYSANSVMVVNGAPNNTASYRLEGMDNTNHTVSFAVQENQPSPDAVQEIAIQTSNYAAEFGAAGGGLFNIVMKSGTNQYHGTGYEYFVNEDLNASRPFSQSLGAGGKFQDRNRRNDFGGTLGGPIFIPKIYDGHNRSFFFWSYEEFRESSLLNPGQTLPVAAFRNGDFSAISVNGGAGFNPNLGVTTTPLPSVDGLGRQIFANTIYDPSSRTVNPANGVAYANPFVLNKINPTLFDPTSVKIQALIPPAQNNSFTNNANYTNISSRISGIPSLKLDHSIGSKSKLSFYWSTTGTESLYSLPNGNADGLPPIITQARGTFIYSQTERLNYDYTLTPTILVHLGGGYSHISFFDGGPVQNFNCADILLKGCQASIFFPRINIGTTGSIGGMQSFGNAQAHTLTNTERPAFNANATWIKGSHTFKLGGEVWFQGQIPNPPSGVTLSYGTAPITPGGNATTAATALPFNPPQGLGSSVIGNPYASFLLGDVQSAAQNAPRDIRMGQSQWAAYLQDSWKVSRKLTVDLGLRWDFGKSATEEYGRSGDFSPTLANTNAGGHPGAFIYEATCHCEFVDNYKYGIGPRIGLAYQITPKTVLRAGWGFVYAPVADIGISTANSLTNSPAGVNAFFNVQDPTTMPQPVFPNFNPSVYPLIVNGAGTVNNSLQSLDRNAARPPRQNQWSIGLQREVTRNLVVEASYVANRGVWWSGPLGLLDQVSPDTFAAYGLHPYTNAADNLLLSSAINAAGVTSRGLGGLPYVGYPTSSTLINTLRPFPQFASAGFGGPLGVTGSATGRTWYDSLQAKGTQRLSHGLSVTTEFTWSKALANPNTTQDLFNPNSSIKQLQSTDQPFLFNIAAVYTTPKARFLDNWKAASWVAKDWQLGVSASYGSGALLTPPSVTTTNNLGSSQMVRVPGQPLYLKDLNCHCINPWSDQLLNPLAWTNPTATGTPDYTTNNSGGSVNGVFGPQTFYSDFRGPRHPIENLNFGRNFRIKERMNFQIRAEFTNALNRTFLGNPVTNVSPRIAIGHNGAGQITSGFGTINATFATSAITGGGFATLAGNPSLPRQGTLIARFTF
jgi:hypothetical protein